MAEGRKRPADRATSSGESSSKIPPFPFTKPVLILSENVPEGEVVLSTIRLRAAESGIESIDIYYGDEITWEDLATETSTGNLFGDRLVIVRRAGDLKSERDGTDEQFLQTPPTGTDVLFVAEALDNRKRSTKLFEKHCHVIKCARPAKDRMPEWIAHFARSRGYSLHPDAAEMVSTFVEDDPLRISNELEKVFLYAGDRKEIREEDIAACMVFTRKEMPWALADHLLSGQVEQALQSLKRHDDAGTYSGILLASIATQLRKMYDITCLREMSVPRAEIIQRLSLNKYYGYQEIEAAARHRKAKIAPAIAESLRTEAILKSVSIIPDRVLLESMVFMILLGLARR